MKLMSITLTIKEIQVLGYRKLQNIVLNPEFETDLLLGQVLKKGRSFLYAHPNKTIFKFQFSIFKRLLKRRQRKEPMAYILGKINFYGLDFKVTPDVLIPRPDTEILVQETLAVIRNTKYGIRSVIDIGTGSGAIAISIAKAIEKKSKIKNQKSKIFGTDISNEALKVSRINARRNKVKIKLLRGNLLDPIIEARLPHPWLITANLPYLTSSEATKSHLKYEPRLALAGGKAGLELIEKLLKQYAQIRQNGDYIILEIGYKQGRAITNLVKKYLPQAKIKIKKDYAGFDRVVEINFTARRVA